MRFLPKIALAIALITVIGTFIFNPKNKESKAIVATDGNQFSLNFDIAKKDQGEFSKILEKLNLPIKNGIKFQLDATSSAALAFASPVNANLKISQNKVEFSGSLEQPTTNQYQPKSLKVPPQANLLVFSPNINYFTKSNLNLPVQLLTYLENSKKPNTGQILALWADKPSWFFTLESKEGLNLDELKLLNNNSALDDPYKREELPNGVQLHLVKTKTNGQEETLVAFQKDGQIFVASAKDVAEEILILQDSNKNTRIFPSQKSLGFALEFQNPQDNPAGQHLFDLVFGNQTSYQKTAQNIADLKFLLKQGSFSGLINLK